MRCGEEKTRFLGLEWESPFVRAWTEFAGMVGLLYDTGFHTELMELICKRRMPLKICIK